jgi:hypothetical protein
MESPEGPEFLKYFNKFLKIFNKSVRLWVWCKKCKTMQKSVIIFCKLKKMLYLCIAVEGVTLPPRFGSLTYLRKKPARDGSPSSGVSVRLRRQARF